MKMRLLFIALAVAAAGAHAQTKKELVAKLVQVQQSGIENVGRMLAAQPAQQMLEAAGQAMQKVPADKREAVGRDIQADVKKFHDEIEPLLRDRALKLAPAVASGMYEERLTEDELKQVIAWLESPTSRKFQQIDRELGNALVEKVVADTRGTVEDKLKALEATVSKRLGVPVAPAAPAASGPKKK
jgi:hypothetical protein